MALPLVVGLRRQRAPEPASRLPLAWGDFGDRSLIGAVLILAGAALIAQTGAFTLALGGLGSAAQVGGWLTVPGRPRQRVIAALVGTAACWCSIGGVPAMWPLVALLPCWLVVRRRPPVTTLLTVLPLAVAIAVGALMPWVADKPIVFAATSAAMVVAALAAREYALRVRVRLVHGRPMGSAASAARTATVD